MKIYDFLIPSKNFYIQTRRTWNLAAKIGESGMLRNEFSAEALDVHVFSQKFASINAICYFGMIKA